jgi:hypothetical protein
LTKGDFMLGDYVNWGTVINFILAITALSGAGIAVWGLIVNRQKLDHDVLVLILNEITSAGASKDREEVRFAIQSGTKAIYIKEQIEKVFIGEDFDLGAAIERTIAHFDYIGFYLMGNTNKIEIEPPKWLWPLVISFWDRLKEWIIYRQTEKYDSRYWLRDYGYYFKKLAEYAKSKEVK